MQATLRHLAGIHRGGGANQPLGRDHAPRESTECHVHLREVFAAFAVRQFADGLESAFVIVGSSGINSLTKCSPSGIGLTLAGARTVESADDEVAELLL